MLAGRGGLLFGGVNLCTEDGDIFVKTRVIPLIIGVTGTISKSFRKYVSDIPGNHDVKELQKTALLGTAHILRKVLT